MTTDVEKLDESLEVETVEELPVDDNSAVDESGDVEAVDTDDDEVVDESKEESSPYSEVDKYLLDSELAQRAKQASANDNGKSPKSESKTPVVEDDEFEIDFDDSQFDEDQAKAIRAALKTTATKLSSRNKELSKLATEQAEHIKELRAYVENSRQTDPNEVYESVRDGLKDFSDVFKTPARKLIVGTDEHTKASALLYEMDAYANRVERDTGRRPKLDEKLATKILAMRDDDDGHPLHGLYSRAKRAKIRNGVNKKAETATTKAGARKSAPTDKEETPEEFDARMLREAKQIRAGKMTV